MTATISEYKIAIHTAVDNCCGRDAYSQEQLDWHLLSTYDNEKSKKEGRAYKRKLALWKFEWVKLSPFKSNPKQGKQCFMYKYR